jgi:phenylalanyl-tRNA synthetase beta chain
MAELADGTITPGIVDYYPNPPQPVIVDLPQAEVTRLLGIELSVAEIRQLLEVLEFKVEEINSATLRVTAPDHRLDISANPPPGRADLVEEIARIYGYDRLPITEMADELLPQRNNTAGAGRTYPRFIGSERPARSYHLPPDHPSRRSPDFRGRTRFA